MNEPGGRGWGRHRKREEAKRVLRLTAGFMADVGWWRWYAQRENIMEGEKMAAPFYRLCETGPEEETVFRRII